MSPRLVLSLSMVLLLVATACSDDQPPGPGGPDGAICGPANCIGCCSNNACVTTPNSAACGSGGQQCLACKAGETCQLGQCSKSSSCGPANCSTGCCQGGLCLLGASNTACGKGGQTCSNCAQAGKTCKSQVCSGGSQTCGPGKCAGCCKAGMCLTGNTNSLCGKGGVTCLNCTASGKTCDASKGSCKGGGPTCSSSSCSTGCCKNNTCHPGNTVSVCGKGGKACQDCSAFGKKCDATTRTCQGGGPTSCSPTNCNGCCKNNTCQVGNTNGVCGKGGAACVDCASSGKTCDSSSGSCKGSTPTCGPSNCNGCCKSNTCQAGNTNGVCGKSGAACVDCASSGKTCDSSLGSCKGGGPSCGPTTCAGCCKGGSCFSGNTASACGKNAVTCVDCSSSGKTCDSSTGACKSNPTTCGPSNCTGCCNGTKCELGYSKTACGKSGLACTTCKAWEACLSGGCTMSAFSKFQITAVSATINQTKTWDWLAVGSYRNPDPFLGIKSGSTGCSGYFINCSKTVANSYTPTWNHNLGTFSGTYAKYPCITIRDEDSTTSGISCPTGYDIIGQCSLTITNADIAAGKKTVTSCPNPSDGKNYVTSFTIGIKHLP